MRIDRRFLICSRIYGSLVIPKQIDKSKVAVMSDISNPDSSRTRGRKNSRFKCQQFPQYSLLSLQWWCAQAIHRMDVTTRDTFWDQYSLLLYFEILRNWWHKYAPSRIWTWDLSICFYLNLKHGDLDHLASTAGFINKGLYNIEKKRKQTNGIHQKFVLKTKILFLAELVHLQQIWA